MQTLNRLFACSLCLSSLLVVTPSRSSAEPVGFVQVSGSALLAGATDHSGTRVLFRATSPSAVTDSAMTDSAGAFSQFVQVGIYDAIYSKQGYEPDTLAGLFFNADTTLGPVTLPVVLGIHISGYISGVLAGDTTYVVDRGPGLAVGALRIASGTTLTIEPGARLLFTDAAGLWCSGQLLALGTAADPVVFTSRDSMPAVGCWSGLTFSAATTETAGSVLNYCRVEYAKSALDFRTPSQFTFPYPAYQVAHSTIQHNTRGISVGTSGGYWNPLSATVDSCSILDNQESGIAAGDYGTCTVRASVIQRNGTGFVGSGWFGVHEILESSVRDNAIGVALTGGLVKACTIVGNGCGVTGVEGTSSGSTVDACLFDGNTECGVDAARVQNCTVVGSPVGVYLSAGDTITSNIVRACSTAVVVRTTGKTSLSHNDFFDNGLDLSGAVEGFGQIVTTNANGDSCDTYFNLFRDPLHMDPGNHDFRLLSGSACIDAGDPALPLDPDGTVADMGAFYFQQGSPGPPTADFSAAPLAGTPPLAVVFTNSSSGAITSYHWDFGDGGTSGMREVVHYYTQPDTYTVSLAATGPGGTDVKVRTDYVKVLVPSVPPTAAFVGSPKSGYVPLEVAFTNQTLGIVDSLCWYFGDGDSSHATSPGHVYSTPGTYTVRLVAYGPYGVGEAIKTDYVTAQAVPAILAAFSGAPRVGIAPLAVSFTDQSIGVVDSWQWHFGDGDSGSARSPVHTYLSPGIYTVSLRVQGLSGDTTETKAGYVQVCDAAPLILSIKDIPEDQGGKVEIRWLRSGYDGVVSGYPIAGYNVWQRYADSWAVVGSIQASRDSTYNLIAVTLRDSTAANPNWTVFRVSAHPDLGYTAVFYSPPDSGYSVDNLAPSAPGGLLATAGIEPGTIRLTWQSVPNRDLRYYAISRDTVANSTSGGTSVGTAIEPTWTDHVATARTYFYRVSAVDFADNRSELSPPATGQAVGVPGEAIPVAYRLRQNVPNPVAATTTIAYDLVEECRVRVTFFDVAGREVAHFDRQEPAGYHVLRWTGQGGDNVRLGPGVYLYRLTAAPISGNPAFVAQRKLVLAR